jgi:hypothetical protein
MQRFAQTTLPFAMYDAHDTLASHERSVEQPLGSLKRLIEIHAVEVSFWHVSPSFRQE